MEFVRDSDFYKKKSSGEKVKSFFEYEKEATYIVEFDSGFYVEIAAKSAREAKIKTGHLQADYGYYKTSYKKKV